MSRPYKYQGDLDALPVCLRVAQATKFKKAVRSLVGCGPGGTLEGNILTLVLFALTDEGTQRRYEAFCQYAAAEGFHTPLHCLRNKPLKIRRSLRNANE